MDPPGQLGNPGHRDCLQPPHPPPPTGTRVALLGFKKAPHGRHHAHTCGRCAGPPSLEKSAMVGDRVAAPGSVLVFRPGMPPQTCPLRPPISAARGEEKDGAWRPGRALHGPLLQHRQAPEDHPRGPRLPEDKWEPPF